MKLFFHSPRGKKRKKKLLALALPTDDENLRAFQGAPRHFRTLFHFETVSVRFLHFRWSCIRWLATIFRSKNSLTDVLAKLGSQHTSPSWILVDSSVKLLLLALLALAGCLADGRLLLRENFRISKKLAHTHTCTMMMENDCHPSRFSYGLDQLDRARCVYAQQHVE